MRSCGFSPTEFFAGWLQESSLIATTATDPATGGTIDELATVHRNREAVADPPARVRWRESGVMDHSTVSPNNGVVVPRAGLRRVFEAAAADRRSRGRRAASGLPPHRYCSGRRPDARLGRPFVSPASTVGCLHRDQGVDQRLRL
jgi:hypothetical protein